MTEAGATLSPPAPKTCVLSWSSQVDAPSFYETIAESGSLGRAGGEQDSRFYLQQFRFSVTVTSGGSLAAPLWASVSLGEIRGFPYTEFMAP